MRMNAIKKLLRTRCTILLGIIPLASTATKTTSTELLCVWRKNPENLSFTLSEGVYALRYHCVSIYSIAVLDYYIRRPRRERANYCYIGLIELRDAILTCFFALPRAISS
jgi:hypothetical protein